MNARVLAITPGDHRTERDVTRLLEAVAEAGVKAVILREPQISGRELVALARRVSQRVPTVILHDRHPEARELAARGGWGLHCAAGTDLRAARAVISGPLGASCHDADAVTAAADARCDYALLSPVFPPGSKPGDRRRPLGLTGLAAVAKFSLIPVYALGGVEPEQARACLDAGATGVAVLSGLIPPGALPDGCAARARAYVSATEEPSRALR